MGWEEVGVKCCCMQGCCEGPRPGVRSQDFDSQSTVGFQDSKISISKVNDQGPDGRCSSPSPWWRLHSTEICSITACSGLTRSRAGFSSIELDSRADHFVCPRKSSPKALRPSTSKKLESSLFDDQLAETYTFPAHVDPHAADIVRPRKSSHRDRRSASTRPTTKLESPLEDASFLQGATRSAAVLFGGTIVLYFIHCVSWV